jgi:2,4-dienoyl-CoA reductase (NADPH2)
MGKEKEYAEYNLKPTEQKKQVMVIGAGPAGMEAARIAALRGHEVSIYDKEKKFGGMLPVATLLKGTEVEDIPAIVRYLRAQILKSDIKVTLGKEVNIESIEEAKPDVIVLALGGTPANLDVQGITNKKVITSSELYKKSILPSKIFGIKVLRWLTRLYLPVGKRTIIIGGSIEGCEAAEFLVKRGRQVTIVEHSDEIGSGMPAGYLGRLIPWLYDKHVSILTGVQCEKISDDGLTIINKEGKKTTIDTDTVLIMMSAGPNTKMLDMLQGKVPEVYLVGAAKGGNSNLIVDAISDGRHVGSII